MTGRVMSGRWWYWKLEGRGRSKSVFVSLQSRQFICIVSWMKSLPHHVTSAASWHGMC